MKKKISLLISTAICIIPFILSLLFYKRLPEQVAIHFDSSGNPDNYASKAFMAFGIPLIMLCVHLLVWFRLETDPKRMYSPTFIEQLSKWLVPISSVIMQTALISYAIDIVLDLHFYATLFIGILIIIMGNYLPKCRQNYTIGIKLPWTLHDDDNWNKTHRMSGYLWILGGIILVINAFLTIDLIIYAVCATLVLFPFFYSYHIYKRNLNRNL